MPGPNEATEVVTTRPDLSPSNAPSLSSIDHNVDQFWIGNQPALRTLVDWCREFVWSSPNMHQSIVDGRFNYWYGSLSNRHEVVNATLNYEQFNPQSLETFLWCAYIADSQSPLPTAIREVLLEGHLSGIWMGTNAEYYLRILFPGALRTASGGPAASFLSPFSYARDPFLFLVWEGRAGCGRVVLYYPRPGVHRTTHPSYSLPPFGSSKRRFYLGPSPP